MKGFWIVILDIVSVIGLTAAAYIQRSYYTVGGEVFLIGGILAISLGILEEKQPCKKEHKAWLKIESR